MTSRRSPAIVTRDVRVIALYRLPFQARLGANAEELPEWQDVRAARPLFPGHRQPRVPGELGWCDVRDGRVRQDQAALAAAHGVHGFCYTFSGLPDGGALDPTLADIADSGLPDFPFCVCWETTALNAGAGFGTEEPSRQRHFDRDECIALIRALGRVFTDPRYVRIGDRPLFVVSSPDPIRSVQDVAATWREECARAGAGNPYIACFGGAFGGDPRVLGFDAIVECPPLGGFPRNKRAEVVPAEHAVAADLRSYRSYMAQILAFPRPDHTVFRSVMPGWDETPRDSVAPKIFVDGNPETFGYWAEQALDQTRLRFTADKRVVFVRSWNEWNAGCHLEPDASDGRRYLEALRDALERPALVTPERPSLETMKNRAALLARTARIVRSKPNAGSPPAGIRVSVVMPAYNHERFVTAALDSVAAQTHRNVEIIAVNDGSRDSTGALLDEYAGRCTSHVLTVVHQSNAGAHEAINRGIALASGEVIAILNSDDRYAPARLERLLAEMDRRGAAFAFSGTRCIDDDDRDVPENDPLVRHIRRAVAEATRAPDLVFTLIYSNIAISTGNFVFRRELLERTGGFCSMRVCHDWEFLLAASYETPLAFLDEPLYEYRLHASNTVASSRVKSPIEVEQLLARFFEGLGRHPIARDPVVLQKFIGHARRLGLGGYLPEGLDVAL